MRTLNIERPTLNVEVKRKRGALRGWGFRGLGLARGAFDAGGAFPGGEFVGVEFVFVLDGGIEAGDDVLGPGEQGVDGGGALVGFWFDESDFFRSAV
jgi:hypothetical protein